MTDLVKQLRWLGDHASFEPHMHHTAADRIEKLEAALRDCVNVLACFERPDFYQLEQTSPIKPYALGALDVARKALEGKDD